MTTRRARHALPRFDLQLLAPGERYFTDFAVLLHVDERNDMASLLPSGYAREVSCASVGVAGACDRAVCHTHIPPKLNKPSKGGQGQA